ncbi:MAG: AraC family transcriptional regulator [Phycisphaerales bacterium]|jgi:AraC family transcriptional regulator of arabinose operon|nr:AraC family transcriptional regulator [Phycisphaerales bacterium]
MPTEAAFPDRRYLVTGHFHNTLGYKVLRTLGCHDWLLIYTLGGKGRFRYSRGTFTTEPHDLVLISPWVYHGYEVEESAGQWELLWAHFVPPTEWLPYLRWPEVVDGLMRLTLPEGPNRRRALDHLAEAHRIKTTFTRLREPLALNALFGCLLWCDEHNPSANHALDDRVREALEILCRNLAEPLSADELASRVGLSASRLRYLFQKQVGISPQQYHENQRIARAQQLLERSGFNIAEISRKVGFVNPFYFTQRFKHALGQSPTQYRRHFGSTNGGGLGQIGGRPLE